MGGGSVEGVVNGGGVKTSSKYHQPPVKFEGLS